MSEWDIKRAIGETHNVRSANGLLDIITATSGRLLEREEGTQPDDIANPTHSGVYVAHFAGGVALMVSYTEGSPGYSEYTPATPARVDYYICTKKASA